MDGVDMVMGGWMGRYCMWKSITKEQEEMVLVICAWIDHGLLQVIHEH